MMKAIFVSGVMLAALSASSFAATASFYVSQDAKTHACMVSDKKPDGKSMMDVGTKAYDSQANAEKAMGNLKVCAAAAAPAPAAPAKAAAPAAMAPAKTAAPATGFYVEMDSKSHKCMVSDKAADGKMMTDVGTKVYETKGRADQAMSMLKACK